MFEPTFVANAKKPWSNTDSSDPPTLFWESRILLFPFLSNHHALCSSPVFHAGSAVNTDLSMWLQIKEQSSPEPQLVQMSQFMEKVIFSVVFCSVYCLDGLFPVLCPDTLWLTCMCGNAHTLTHTHSLSLSLSWNLSAVSSVALVLSCQGQIQCPEDKLDAETCWCPLLMITLSWYLYLTFHLSLPARFS